MMNEELNDLLDWLRTAKDYELPTFKELPRVPLYMEQIISYVNETLAPLMTDDYHTLTSFMVNNYVKAKIIKEPVKKKYNEEHIGYLFAICTLKRSLSMTELSLIIDMDSDVSKDKSALYGFFRLMWRNIIQSSASKALEHVEDFANVYERDSSEDPEKAQKLLCDSLGLIAFRMSIQASIYMMISSKMLDTIAKVAHPEEAYKEEKQRKSSEIRRQNEINETAAQRVAKAKDKMRKKELKDAKKSAKHTDSDKEEKR